MYTSKIINPATGKPFTQASPSSEVIKLRKKILRKLSINAKYDAAQDSSQNELHWINADELSPHSANSLSVRKKLRSRSRYEVANNGYLMGILLSLANDFAGSGPTLQITDQRFSDDQRGRIERQYLRRAKKIKLRQKIWQLRFAKSQDGEGISLFYTDRSNQVSLVGQKVIECDLMSHFNLALNTKPNQTYLEIDGVRFSRSTGDPVSYHILNDHPGETFLQSMQPLGGKWIPASSVIHWIRRTRPYLRGIPETTPTLPLWALLRRYTLAVVQNAEIAADFTVLLKSLQPPNMSGISMFNGEPSETDPDDWFSSFPVDRGLMTVLPSSYDMDQLDPKQPVTVYDTFVNALVQEAARCLLTPRNVALGNSGGYNMASGALDRQTYIAAIAKERMDAEDDVLDPDLKQWWFDAIRQEDYFEDEVSNGDSINAMGQKFRSLKNEPPDHIYRWDEVPEHTDPVKVATAIDILHRGGHLSDVDIQEGRFNRRVEDHYANLEIQQTAREALGFVNDPNMDGIAPNDNGGEDNLDTGNDNS